MLVELCFPVHNEGKILRENALILLNFLAGKNYNFQWAIYLLNNGSKDKTEEIGRKLEKENRGKIKLINIPGKGRGIALKTYWLQSSADILVYMDIDLAASLDNLGDLLAPLLENKADLVIGSRLLPDSKIKRSFFRELSSQGYNIFSRLILGHKFSDLQCGFKAVNARIFKKYAGYISDKKWFFDTELVYAFYFFKKRIKEIPVDWQEERYNQRKSKVRMFRDSIKFIINLIKLKRRYRFLRF
jgi:glycosyltransferase involved in cell wall biosynthesis